MHSLAVEQLEQEERLLAESQQRIADTTKAQELLQELAQAVEQDAHTQIGRVVSRCLSAVFGESYELQIGFEKKRGKTEAEFTYLRDGNQVDPHMDSGGVLDIAVLACRLAKLVLALPPADKTLILDEPMRCVSRQNLPLVAQLIATLAKEMGVQFVLATHSDDLEIGKVVRL